MALVSFSNYISFIAGFYGSRAFYDQQLKHTDRVQKQQGQIGVKTLQANLNGAHRSMSHAIAIIMHYCIAVMQ